MIKNFFKNKKAGEKLLSIWWLIVLALVAVAVVAGVLIYYGAELNTKKIEAKILHERIYGCLVEQGVIRQDFIEEKNNFNIFSKCGLSQKILDSENFYFKIVLSSDEESFENIEVKKGKTSIEADCDVSEGVVAKHYAKCLKRNYVVSDFSKKNKFKLFILTASNQQGTKISDSEYNYIWG